MEGTGSFLKKRREKAEEERVKREGTVTVDLNTHVVVSNEDYDYLSKCRADIDSIKSGNLHIHSNSFNPDFFSPEFGEFLSSMGYYADRNIVGQNPIDHYSFGN